MKAIAVDTGGTFTDMVVLDQDTGILSVLKLPSTPDEPGRAIIDGLREIFAGGVAPADMLSLSHGTTVGTNALLTGSGAHVGLFVTEGFGAINDVWHLAPSEDSSRATSVYVEKKPPVLPRFRREARERVTFKGEVAIPLDEDAAAEAVRSLGRRGIESIAVVLLFSFLNPAHEERIAEIIEREMPGTAVSLSSRVLPQMREYPRLSTTVANAYISPVMGTYLAALEGRVRNEQVTSDALYVMQSNGASPASEALRLSPRFSPGRAPARWPRWRWPPPRGSTTPCRSTWAAPARTSRSASRGASSKRHRGASAIGSWRCRC